ncbi:MAG: hypothetical protein WB992_19595 [Bryobacteraceae bacterium]
MPTYCNPLIGSREWQETDDWGRSDHEKIDRLELAEILARHKSSAPKVSIEEEFAQLLNDWRESTQNMSSLTQILSHPAYQRIIELGRRFGPRVTPLILVDYKDHGDHWATALQAITGENPVNSKSIGNSSKVRKDWLRWGEQHGYLQG